MLAKLLVELLEKLIEEHEPHKEQMGELDIMIDTFTYTPSGTAGIPGDWKYAGFSPNIESQLTEDGGYHVLAAKETWE